MAIQSFEEILLERIARLEARLDELTGTDKPASTLISTNRIAFGGANSKLTSDSDLTWDNTANQLRANGALHIGSNVITVPHDGTVSIGNTAVNFNPSGTNWTDPGQWTLMLNGLTDTAIGFHDSGVRIDYIRVGAGVITLGHDGGWGNARVAIPGGVVAPTYTNLTLVNGWVNFGGAWPPAQYGKDALGYVHIRGLIASGTFSPGTLITTLPAGYRPIANEMYALVCSGGFAAIDIGSNGALQIRSAGGNVFLSLFGITFLAEN